MSLKLGSRKVSTGPTATAKCSKCGYALLATQRRCPECGFIPAAPPTGKHRVVQLYQQGPQAVLPIAARFFAMGVLAASGPIIVATTVLLSTFAGMGRGLSIAASIAWCIAPLPIVVMLSMPRGWGSIGGDDSPVPVERVRVFRIPVHKIALATTVCWWVLAVVILFGAPPPFAPILYVLMPVGAAVSAYFHLNWLADLGLAVADEGPHRVLNVCVSIAILSAIVALIAGAFASSWIPMLVAFLFVVLSVIAGEIWASMQLGRDMVLTLVEAYEEVNREARRAARAAEHEPRFPV